LDLDAEWEQVRLCPDRAEVGSTLKQDFSARRPHALKADFTNDAAVDFLFATKEGDLTLINATTNKVHDVKPREIAQRVEAQQPNDSVSIKYMWLTDEITAPRMKLRELKDSLKDEKHQKARNNYLIEWSSGWRMCPSILQTASGTSNFSLPLRTRAKSGTQTEFNEKRKYIFQLVRAGYTGK